MGQLSSSGKPNGKASTASSLLTSDVSAKLEDPDPEVRRKAVLVFRGLSSAELAQCGPALGRRLADYSADVRREAVLVLGKLEPADLELYGQAIGRLLSDSDGFLRWKAAEVLSCLDGQQLVPLAPQLALCLVDKDWTVRQAAVAALGNLDALELVEYSPAIATLLSDMDVSVRLRALETLSAVDPIVLAEHAPTISGLLQDQLSFVRKAAVEALARLEPADFHPYGAAVTRLLEDTDAQVRRVAEQAVEGWEPLVEIIKHNGSAFDLASLPDLIGKSQVDEVRDYIQGLAYPHCGKSLESYFPPVVISYARKAAEGDEAAGDSGAIGLCQVAAIQEALFRKRIPSYSWLTAPSGARCDFFLLRLKFRNVSNAKVLIVLLSKVFYNSPECLKQVSIASEAGIAIVPVLLEPDLPRLGGEELRGAAVPRTEGAAFFDDFDAHFKELVASIQAIMTDSI